jgi:AcrR family transcriptional regulator
MSHSDTKRQILDAAARIFAHRGYAAASVQEIVDAAKVSKPALYYYFGDKAGLYQALVDEAHDARHERVRAAAARGHDLRSRLVEALSALFDFVHARQELVRIAFATTLAAPGELPEGLCRAEKCQRSMDFIESLMKAGQAEGVLDKRFDSRELAYALYGQVNFLIVSQLLMPRSALNRQTAERIVDLFLSAAAARRARAGSCHAPAGAARLAAA